jgi:type I restriction enzyme S subunit
MAGEWQTLPLGDVTNNFDGRRIPVKEADRKPGPYPYYGASGIVDYVDGYLFDGEHLLIAEDGENLRTRQTPVAFIARGKFWVNNHAHIVQGNERATTRFLHYALAATDISGYLTGSTMPKLTQGNLNRISVVAPPIPEQKRIAHILGTLDDKIELNRRMNATLEAMSRAIFKSWFVDFDPVRQKAAGKQPVGMDARTAALFPDSFEDSEIGEVPKGWGVDAFADHFDADRGLSYKGEGLRNDGSGVPMHNLNSIYEGGGYKHEGIKYYAGEYRDKHLISPGDVIVTNTEQGFDHLLIGHAAIVPACFGPTGLYSHHIYRVRCKPSSPLTPNYVVSLLNDPRWHYWISGFSNGTTINMLPLDALQMPLLVVPPPALAQVFDQLAMSTHERREANLQQSRTLATLRDTLLPKLLSGEVRVPEAEGMVERVAGGA